MATSHGATPPHEQRIRAGAFKAKGTRLHAPARLVRATGHGRDSIFQLPAAAYANNRNGIRCPVFSWSHVCMHGPVGFL